MHASLHSNIHVNFIQLLRQHACIHKYMKLIFILCINLATHHCLYMLNITTEIFLLVLN